VAERFNRTRSGVAAVVALGVLLAVVHVADIQARATVQAPEFTFAPDRGLVGNFGGYGAQFNQHVYANISGPPPDVASLETKVLALQPQFVRIFFNTTEWTFPDRMASFVRTVQLAQRAQAEINITWQGSTFAYAMANMSRFADVLADLQTNAGIRPLWVTLFNEPNSTRLTLTQYEQVYRQLDGYLRERGVRDRIRFMGGDLVGTTSPLGQSQGDWLTYIASRMGDLLDGWSIHVYWDFWDAGKIERRLATVRNIFAAIPAEQRRPVYVTEFGVRGVRTFEGEANFQPYLWPDGTPLAETTAGAFQEAWFMIRASQLGYSAAVLWDAYTAKYDAGTQDYSAIGPGTAGWPIRPVYHLLHLMTVTTTPRGGSIVEVAPSAAADPSKLLTAYVSPGAGITILGLDTAGGSIATVSDAPVAYSVGGLPPNTLFRLVGWNAAGGGTNLDYGFLDSGPTGRLDFSVPVHAVFALSSTSIGSPPW
jgi:hypothetical protein